MQRVSRARVEGRWLHAMRIWGKGGVAVVTCKSTWGKGRGVMVACKEYLRQRWRGSGCKQIISEAKVKAW